MTARARLRAGPAHARTCATPAVRARAAPARVRLRVAPAPAGSLARALTAIAVALAVALAAAPAAAAHAQLLGTSPASGSTVQAQPREVIFEFNQPVGGTARAVRVYDAHGAEVDDLEVSHPGGHERWIGVGLKPGLPDGTYTATYRVISADTHIVYGGLVFNLGHASAYSRVTVAGLIAKNESGEVTRLAFGAVRALNYLTLALIAGALAFALLVWPGASAPAGIDGARWHAASQRFFARIDALLACAVIVGVLVSVLGVLLQGASAAGVSLWSSLKGTIVQGTLESRFGWVWGVRAIVWCALGGLLLCARALRADAARTRAGAGANVRRTPDLARPGVGLTGAGERGVERVLVAALALGTAYLLLTPALAGHASIESPTGVFFPADVIHVAAASVWVGGVACLLLALPAATRTLDGAERSRLLLAALARFSPLALGAVIAIAITGGVQAYIDVRTVHGLLHTTYGALVLVKTALLLALVTLGWVNRARVLPSLRAIVADAALPGGVGRLARRTLRGELAAMACVLGVTAALVAYAPPIDAAKGPFSTNATLGPAELELTVEPARVGPNTIHLYLIDANTGAQFTATKELTVTARLPAKGIGPLQLHPNLAGPGHYVLNSAVLSPGGSWRIEVIDRVSEFEQHTRVVDVPIE